MTTRKGIGGRQPTIIPNPFVFVNEWGDTENTLCVIDRNDIRVEDILVGCVRSFNAHLTVRQDYVNWYKLYKVYKNCNEITRPLIQTYLTCSESQAKRFIQVIKLANPFLKRLVEGASGSNIVGYPEMNIYAKPKERLTLNHLKQFAE